MIWGRKIYMKPLFTLKHFKFIDEVAICCFSIYFFNCTDLIFTYTFVKTGYFFEINPFMRFLLTNPLLILSFKLFLPACAFWAILRVPHSNPESLSKFFLALLGLILFFYIAINVSHLYYLYLFFQQIL